MLKTYGFLYFYYKCGIISSAISTARDAPAATTMSERQKNTKRSATAVPVIAEAR